jgi:hypothetical protein
MLGWWAADDLALADNADVAAWAGKYGPELTSATNRPVFKTNIKNGLPAVRYTAANNDSLITASGPWMRNVTGGTQFFVASRTGTGDQALMTIDKNLAGYDRFSTYLAVTTGYVEVGGRRLDADGYAGLVSTTPAPSSPAIIRSTRDWSAGTASIHVNGVATSVNNSAIQTSGSTSDTDSSGIRLGRANSSLPFDGDIFEVVVYERVLDAAEIAQVESYLTTKYAL